MANRKVMIILFNSWIDKKKCCYIKMSYFPEPCTNKNKIEVKLDLRNYATIC